MSGSLEERAGRGATGAFLLGIAFSLAFCPPLFLLFFGLTIPMALASPFGAFYPATFALGTTLPLLAIAAALAVGFGSKAGYTSLSRRIGSLVQPAAAVPFILSRLRQPLVRSTPDFNRHEPGQTQDALGPRRPRDYLVRLTIDSVAGFII